MESKDWSGFGYFSPDLEKIKQLLVCSKHHNTWEDTGNVVKVFFSIQSKKKNVRQWKEIEFSTPFVVKAATSLLLNSLKFSLEGINFLLSRNSWILKLWNDVRWILKLEFESIGKLCQLVSRAEQALTKFNSFKRMQKSRQKFVMTQFVLWFCQENSGFVCYCR